MLGRPLSERRALLKTHVLAAPGCLEFAQGREVCDEAGLAEALAETVVAQAEGLMCKALHGADSGYEPGKRSLRWLKLKPDYIDGLGDTLDLVPIGAYYGEGRRAGTFGAYLLGCWDEASGRWQPVCKLGSGLTDKQLTEWYAFFTRGEGAAGAAGIEEAAASEACESTCASAQNLPVTEEVAPAASADSAATPALPDWLDVAETGLPTGFALPHLWLAPRVVWEVKAAALSLSPVWGAARGAIPGGGERGLALRFPRLARVRDDKTVLDATSSAQLASMFAQQPEAVSAQAVAAAAAAAAATRALAEQPGVIAEDVRCGVAAGKSGEKFWRAQVRGKSLVTTWGKVGSAGQSRTKECESEAAAQALRDKKQAEKEAAGYQF